MNFCENLRDLRETDAVLMRKSVRSAQSRKSLGKGNRKCGSFANFTGGGNFAMKELD